EPVGTGVAVEPTTDPSHVGLPLPPPTPRPLPQPLRTPTPVQPPQPPPSSQPRPTPDPTPTPPPTTATTQPTFTEPLRSTCSQVFPPPALMRCDVTETSIVRFVRPDGND